MPGSGAVYCTGVQSVVLGSTDMGSESWVMCVLGDVQRMCCVGQKDLGPNLLKAVGSGDPGNYWVVFVTPWDVKCAACLETSTEKVQYCSSTVILEASGR